MQILLPDVNLDLAIIKALIRHVQSNKNSLKLIGILQTMLNCICFVLKNEQFCLTTTSVLHAEAF